MFNRFQVFKEEEITPLSFVCHEQSAKKVYLLRICITYLFTSRDMKTKLTNNTSVLFVSSNSIFKRFSNNCKELYK